MYLNGLGLWTGLGPVDRNFIHVDPVNRLLMPVNRPNWHFEMACILLMTASWVKPVRIPRTLTPAHPAKNPLFPAHPGPPIPESTLLHAQPAHETDSRSPSLGHNMGLWPSTTGGKTATSLERKGARCKSWALLVTQRPTCQVAAFITHWCRTWKGLTQPLPSLRKSLPAPDILPSQASHLHRGGRTPTASRRRA